MSGYIGPKTSDIPVGTIATKGTISGNSLVIGSNVVANTSAISIGSATINSTVFSATANNSTYAFGKAENALNVNSAVYANSSSTNTFTVGSGTYFVANGSVGIGTNSPVGYSNYTTLEVRNTGGGLLRLGNSATNAGYIYHDGTNMGVTNLTTTGMLDFYANSSIVMRVAANGNVGVGLTNPTYKLDVAGTVRTTGITRLGMNVGYYNINSSSTDLTSANTSAVQICGTGGDGLFIGQYANTVSTVWIQASYFNPSLATYPIILNPLGGNIGIGIGNTAPASRLHVANEIRIGRTDASSEGGEIKLCRSIDDAAAYSIDVYGSTTNPELRMFNSIGGTVFFSSANSGVNYIKFNPTQNAVGDANCLDDYEEGTYTPSAVVGTTTQTAGIKNGWYTKVGRLVNVSCEVTNITLSGTGTLYLSLPFPAASGPYYGGSIRWGSIASTGIIVPLLYQTNTSYIFFQSYNSSGYTGEITHAVLAATYHLYTVSFTYYTS